MAREKTEGIYFKLTEAERGLIEQKMALADVRNMSAYIRKMCIDGYTVNLQLPELRECQKYLRSASNNLNQITRKANAGGTIYPDEMDRIDEDLKNCKKLFGDILEQLSKIR